MELSGSDSSDDNKAESEGTNFPESESYIVQDSFESMVIFLPQPPKYL